MKIQILSDLHTEFMTHFNPVNIVPKGIKVDVLIVAGDLTNSSMIEYSLKQLTKYYDTVIYIPGNHEYYQSSFKKVNDFLTGLNVEGALTGDDSVFTLDGQRFVCSTLWFPDDPENVFYEHSLNDFHLIKDIKPTVYEKNKESVDFLNNYIQEGDIVITHHCPSHKSTPDRFKGSELNRFFVCDMEDLILERKPKLWIHGHTHNSFDYMIGDTRIICNPFGYLGMEENPDFQKHLIIEV